MVFEGPRLSFCYIDWKHTPKVQTFPQEDPVDIYVLNYFMSAITAMQNHFLLLTNPLELFS